MLSRLTRVPLIDPARKAQGNRAGVGRRFNAEQSPTGHTVVRHHVFTRMIHVRKTRKYPTISAMHPANDISAAPWRGETTGLVLAGGAGRRMHGRDKGLVAWRGKPLVTYAAASLRPLARELIISCNRHTDDYRRVADRVISDDRAGYQGPLAGLEAARDRVVTPLLLVTPCDMPGLPAVVYAQLLAALQAPRERHRDAIFLHSGGRDYYLCLALRRAALAGLSLYLDRGERSVRGWLATLDSAALRLELPDEQLSNVNALWTGQWAMR